MACKSHLVGYIQFKEDIFILYALKDFQEFMHVRGDVGFVSKSNEQIVATQS